MRRHLEVIVKGSSELGAGILRPRGGNRATMPNAGEVNFVVGEPGRHAANPLRAFLWRGCQECRETANGALVVRRKDRAIEAP